MADRKVKVTLSAQVADYKRGMLEAAQATRTAGTEAEKLAQQREAFQTLGRTALAAGSLIGVGLGVAVAKFAEFDQAMSNVSATGEDARENIDALREAALEAGASTVFSATESANAIEELAKAGLSAAQILSGGLKGSLDLAAAGGLGVAEAAGIAATTMQQFQLKGSDASHVADLLAAGAGKAMGDVQDMAAALNQAGLVAAQFGLSTEETTGTLAAFANAGLLGSDAGTSFRTMLLRLANPTEEVKNLMAELGIEAYDSQGQFIGMARLAGELQSSLRGMTQEQQDTTLAMIFGQDAIRGANILLREGSAGIRRWTDDVDDQGYAAETAAERLNNLKGDLEALSGAFDSALISMGAAADGPARFVVQLLTDLIDQFNDLPVGAQQAVFWVGLVAAASLSAYGGFLLLTPKVVEYRKAVDQLGPGAQKADRYLSGLARTLGLFAAAGVAMTLVDQLSRQLSEQLGPSAEVTANRVKTATSAVNLFTAALRERGLADGSKFAAEAVDQLGEALDAIGKQNFFSGPLQGSFGEIESTLSVLGKELGTLADSDLPAAQAQFRQLAEDAGLSREQQMQLVKSMPEFEKKLVAQASAQGKSADAGFLLSIALGEAAGSTDEAAAATGALEEAADQAEKDLDALRETLLGIGGSAISAGEAIDQARSAVLDLAEAAEAEGAAIDGSNDASISLRDTIRDVEQAHRDAALAILDNNGTLDEAKGKYYEGREAIIQMLEAKGMDRTAAEQWADTNLGAAGEVVNAMAGVATSVTNIPNGKEIELNVRGNAVDKIREINNWLNATPQYKDISIGVNGGISGLATGGPVIGPGTGTSDTAGIFRLSNGEHVLTAAEVDAMGGHDRVERFRAQLRNGTPISGGELERVYATPVAQATGTSPPAAVYVQNPFTGEYLLAKTAEVAGGVVAAADAASSRVDNAGKRKRF